MPKLALRALLRGLMEAKRGEAIQRGMAAAISEWIGRLFKAGRRFRAAYDSEVESIEPHQMASSQDP